VSANLMNTLLSMTTLLFDLVMWLFILRIVLQLVRADFYNPLSQLIMKTTRYPTDALRYVLPNLRNFNVAAAVSLFAIAVVYVHIISGFGVLGHHANRYEALVWAVMKIATLVTNLYTFTLVVQAILVYLGPGVNNPASNVLWSMNEPLLRPVRRFVSPVSGLDISFIVVILALRIVNGLIPLHGALR
jgi:YggT family protein